MKRGCSQCGECLDVCPVFQEYKREEYSPKGKRVLMEGLPEAGTGAKQVSPELSWEKVKKLSRLCAGCGRCKRACARGLSTADLLADLRAAHPHWTQAAWELWIRRLGPLWPAVGVLASLLPHRGMPEPLQAALAPARALLNTRPFAPWIRLLPGEPEQSPSLALFAGCTANRVRKEWRTQAEELLRRCGYSLLEQEGFTCCGGSLYHAGRHEAARALREQNIAHWRELGRPRLVLFCASCHHSLMACAGDIMNKEEAAHWKDCLVPLSSLLAGARSEVLPAMPDQCGYHQPCHWDGADRDEAFLQGLFPGLFRGSGLCCGMGGILKMNEPGLSMRMATRCLSGFPPQIRDIVTGCSGCVLQLAAAAPSGLTVSHWLDRIM